MATLTVGGVQAASGLDPTQNRDRLRGHVEALVASAGPDVVVFPEVFARDFGEPGSDVSGFAEDLDGPFVTTLVGLAGQYCTTLVSGMFERSGDPRRPYNTLVVVDGEGVRASYRKIHLYDSFGYRESDRLLAGDVEPLVVDVAGFAVGLMTCYDLRFPELGRELVTRGAEVLLVPAAWVAGPGKVQNWRTLVAARAIENTVYVVGVAQPGPRYSGHSLVVAPDGGVLTENEEGEEATFTTVLDRAALAEARERNPSLANRRL